MAGYNEILAGRYNRLLQKLFGMKGGPPSPSLSGDIQPGFAIFAGVENRYIESWERFWGTNAATGGVAQVGAIRYRNPAGSNVVAVFEKITVATLVVQDIDVQQLSTGLDLTTVVSTAAFRMDRRGRPQPSLIVSTTTNYAAAGTVNWAAFLAATTTYEVIYEDDQEITLLPGDDLTVFSGTTNVQTRVSAMWRERALEESERA